MGTVTQKGLDHVQAALDEAVRLAFSRFPIAPASPVPPVPSATAPPR